MYLSKHNIIVPLDTGSRWQYVLLNSLVGNVNYLDEDFHSYIRDLKGAGMTTAGNAGKNEQLQSRGYMFASENGEKEKEESIIKDINKTMNEKKRNSYRIIPQNTCSAGCSYCKYQDQLDGSIMSSTTLKKIMDFILDFDKSTGAKEKPILTFYGNESLPDSSHGFSLIRQVLENHQDDLGFFCFQTNGFNLKRYKPLLLNADFKKLVFIFSLLENEERTGDEDLYSADFEASLDWLRSRGIRTVLVIKITEDNVAEIPAYVNRFIKKGLAFSKNCQFQFSPTFKRECTLFNPCSVNYALYEKIFEIYRDNPQLEFAKFSGRGAVTILRYILKSRERFSPNTFFCEANWNFLVFDSLGRIYPCSHAVRHPKWSVGNINNGAEIFENAGLQEWRGRKVSAVAECNECPAKYLCGGGCSFEALVKKGSLYRANCQPYRDLIKWSFENFHEDFMESAKYNRSESNSP